MHMYKGPNSILCALREKLEYFYTSYCFYQHSILKHNAHVCYRTHTHNAHVQGSKFYTLRTVRLTIDGKHSIQKLTGFLGGIIDSQHNSG